MSETNLVKQDQLSIVSPNDILKLSREDCRK